MQRFIIEMGMGNDQYGQDQTKAALRAVEDAIRHSSIPMFDTLGIDPDQMEVRVTLGAPKPNEINLKAVRAYMPRGKASVSATQGGLSVRNGSGGTITIVTAAVEAFLPYQGDT